MNTQMFISGERLASHSVFSDAMRWESATFTSFSKGGICWISASDPDSLKTVRACARDNIKSVVVTDNLDIKEMQRSFLVGARGYSHINMIASHYRDIAGAVTSGGLWVPAGLITAIVHRLSEHPNFQLQRDCQEQLTEREEEILAHLLNGASNQAMAEAMSISLRTVKEHMSSILRKYRVKDRVGLLLKIGNFRRTAL